MIFSPGGRGRAPCLGATSYYALPPHSGYELGPRFHSCRVDPNDGSYPINRSGWNSDRCQPAVANATGKRSLAGAMAVSAAATGGVASGAQSWAWRTAPAATGHQPLGRRRCWQLLEVSDATRQQQGPPRRLRRERNRMFCPIERMPWPSPWKTAGIVIAGGGSGIALSQPISRVAYHTRPGGNP